MPRLRIPLWAAVGIPAAAYAIRSLARGSAMPDLPEDVVVFGVLVMVLLIASRYGTAAQQRREKLAGHVHHGDDAERGGR